MATFADGKQYITYKLHIIIYMEKKPNNYIAVSYTLYASASGEENLVEQTQESRPFEFITGFGAALDAFEEKVLPMAAGAEFDLHFSKEQAFGEHDAAQVIEVRRETFTIDGKFDEEHIYLDAVVPLRNEEGQHFFGRVIELDDSKVTLDLNHPLAGLDLHFVGKVLENRPADNKEIESFAKMLSGEGGCGCDCEGHDCDCGDENHHEGGCGCGHCHH